MKKLLNSAVLKHILIMLLFFIFAFGNITTKGHGC